MISLTVYQALTLMVTFATLIVAILSFNHKK
ncbi:putative holin-like toxin [Aneurinibacillus tyrosinisolvens]